MSMDQGKKGMTEFELGVALSRIETKVDGVIAGHAEFKQSQAGHEQRLRALEQGSATKQELADVLRRLEDLKTNQWKTWVYMALTAGAAGGTAGVLAKMIFGG